jgi:hypothetical protein
MNPKKCSFSGCDLPRMKRPGNTTMFFKFCQQHQIEAVLSKFKAEADKDKAGLEIMKQRGSGKAKSDNSKALKLADDWFSKFIRLNHSFELNGIQQAKCFTCENIRPIIELDCGHFEKRQYMATRHQPDNARPQCTSCNQWKKGQYEIFEQNLCTEISKSEVENLKQLAKSTFHCSTDYLRGVAKIYKAKFNELLKQRGIKSPWK